MSHSTGIGLCIIFLIYFTFLTMQVNSQYQIFWNLLRTRQKIEDQKEEIERATKVKSEFLANMSHEIRTPMNGIVGMTNLVLNSPLNDLQTKYLKVIQNCGVSLLDLINSILDFSKLEANKIELEAKPFPLHECVEEVIVLMGPKATEKGVSISYHHDANTPDWILGDITRLKQILMNLIGNATKFTEKGSIQVISKPIATNDHEHTIQFSVKDTGIGIPDHLMGKLFQSFSQVDASTTRKYGGSGLGLAICKGLCERMGGTVWVESKVGQGSIFSFTFKATETIPMLKPTHNKHRNEIDEKMGQKHPLRILVADDNHTNQLVVIGFLQKIGYRADIANDGLEVLRQLENAAYDVILMDCHMPQMDGFEATRLINEKFPIDKRPQVVALTASSTKQDIDRCYAAGMVGHIAKPVSLPILAKTLSQMTRLPGSSKSRIHKWKTG